MTRQGFLLFFRAEKVLVNLFRVIISRKMVKSGFLCYFVSVLLASNAVIGEQATDLQDYEPSDDVRINSNNSDTSDDFPTAGELTNFKEALEEAKTTIEGSTAEMRSLVSTVAERLKDLTDRTEPADVVNRFAGLESKIQQLIANQTRLVASLERHDTQLRLNQNFTLSLRDTFAKNIARMESQIGFDLKNATAAVNRSLERLNKEILSRLDWEQIQNHSDALHTRHNFSSTLREECERGLKGNTSADQKPAELFCAFLVQISTERSTEIKLAFQRHNATLKSQFDGLKSHLEAQEAATNKLIEEALTNLNNSLESAHFPRNSLNKICVQSEKTQKFIEAMLSRIENATSKQREADQDLINDIKDKLDEMESKIITAHYSESREEQKLFGVLDLNLGLMVCVLLCQIIVIVVVVVCSCEQRKSYKLQSQPALPLNTFERPASNRHEYFMSTNEMY